MEQRLLSPAEKLLEAGERHLAGTDAHFEARFAILEHAAAELGGWRIKDLPPFSPTDRASSEFSTRETAEWARQILASIGDTPIPPALALCALSREPLTAAAQRTRGAYYTDWRLAEALAQESVPRAGNSGLWIDPACGTGALLVAAAQTAPKGSERDAIIADRLTGADLSLNALRGARLAVASLTRDLGAVESFKARLLQQDSLLSEEVWNALAPRGAALVIANPPWEKLKTTRHEIALRNGIKRSYGSAFFEEIDIKSERKAILSYLEKVVKSSILQGRGEHDLYKLFLELSLGLVADGGVLGLLLPAGLIRSKGTEKLRRELILRSEELSFSVMENRAAHFAIDTRFKFLSTVAKISSAPRKDIELKVADRQGQLPTNGLPIGREDLAFVRPDLSIPEVRTAEEWALYSRLTKNSTKVGDEKGPWNPRYLREVDMTRDSKYFWAEPRESSLPVIEGRHVAQFRSRAKTYSSGEGRAAIWIPEPLSRGSLRTHWNIDAEALRPAALERSALSRIGFCDIAGQTNERSLMTARIPAGVVCGNKVPTLLFPNGSRELEDLFLALTNSFLADWMLRRTLTTTLNFFVFDNLSLPNITPDSTVGKELIELARTVTSAEGDPKTDEIAVGNSRARIDALIAYQWGITLTEMELVLCDFPLLDRGQPPLPGEERSTVTRDCVLHHFAKISGTAHPSSARFLESIKEGAVPYTPADYRTGRLT